MRFRILGKLLMTCDDGTTLYIRGNRQRSILTILLLYYNQAVSTDKLIDLLWDDSKVCSRSALRNLILEVRRRHPILRDRLHTAPGSYLMTVKPAELDLDEFRGLADQGHEFFAKGDWSAAAKSLRQAASLWRDLSLPDFPTTQSMRSITENLVNEYLVVSDYLIDARLELGEHRELQGELRARVANDPLDEHAVGQLMLALYRSGRQAEALDVMARTRELLSEEYGIDPHPSLQKLQQQILSRDLPLLTVSIALVGMQVECAQIPSLGSADYVMTG